jgi:uncharacterized protein (DUF924 family)
MNYEDILDFWFKDLKPMQWFKKDEKLDALIGDRFLKTYQMASKSELYEWRTDPKGALSEILVLDQFSRNIFRDKAQAFAFDSLALCLAQNATANKLDEQLNTTERGFMYMPFMHSESLAIHEKAVELFSIPGLEGNLDFEYKHKKIIEQFGRYPHRNKILGRTSTPEEIEFLLQPGSSF